MSGPKELIEALPQRTQALRQLRQLGERYRAEGDGQRYLQQLNGLLKAVALRSSDRRDIAGASGASNTPHSAANNRKMCATGSCAWACHSARTRPPAS